MSNNIQQEEEEIDLKALFFTLLRYWKSIFLTAIIGGACAVVYLKTTLPVYSTNAILQVESKGGGSELLLGDLAGFDSQSQVSTEVEILKSRMILGRVSEHLNLNIDLRPKDTDIISKYFNKQKILLVNHKKSGVTYADNDQVLKIKKFTVSEDLLDKNFELTILNDDKYQLTLLDGDTNYLYFRGKNTKVLTKKSKQGNISLDFTHKNLVNKTFILKKKSFLNSTNAIHSKLSASEKGKKTGILVLQLQGVNKQKITDTLNEIISIYVNKNLEKKSAEKEKTLDFLEIQLPEIKQKLEISESKFNAFRDKNKTLDVDKEAQILLEQNIGFEKAKLELEQKRAELSTRFTSEYPLLRKIDDQLAVVMSKKQKVSQRLKVMPDLQQQYLQLFRDVKINTELYTNMLNNYQTLKIAHSGEVGNLHVIDRAIAPLSSIKPKKRLIILIGLLLGVFVGIAFAFIRRLFNFGIKDSSDIEAATGLPVLANIPQSEQQLKFFGQIKSERMTKFVKLFKLNKFRKSHHFLSKLLFVSDNEDMAIEALRSLRTSLFFSMHSAKNNVIMITGASPGIGKSFVTANFSAVLAEADNRVIVIDADLRRGYLHDYFGIENTGGIVRYASTDDNFELFKKTAVDNLTFIPRGKNKRNVTTSNRTTNILMSDKFTELVSALSEEYDYVVLDTPPTLAVTDAQIMSELAGTTLFVARYGVSHLGEVKLSVDRLRAGGANVAGIIFNSVIKEGGYGYGYGYQYGYNYKSKQ